jgi:SAM-dependent methyltransferase
MSVGGLPAKQLHSHGNASEERQLVRLGPRGKVRVPTAVTQRNASPELIAAHLNAEWGDILFSDSKERMPDLKSPLESDTLNICNGSPGRFYRRVARVTSAWTSSLDMQAGRICDVGSSAGRIGFELSKLFPDASEIVLAEPLSIFCEWARRILKGIEFDRWIPEPYQAGRPSYRLLDADALPEPVPTMQIYNVSADSIPRPEGYFDLVLCLNVIDRIGDAGVLVADLMRLVRPGGLVVAASPLDFDERYTDRSKWLSDLHDLFDPNYWEIADREINLRYEFLRHRRRLVSYLSQVLGAVRKAKA